jgi:putative endonuclease
MLNLKKSNSNLNNTEKGRLAEDLAIDYLIKSNYQILEANWRHKKAEIDVIAQVDNTIVFVEVKSRSNDFFGKPETAVTEKKKKLIIAGATSYMEAKGYDGQIRFDIVSLVLRSKEDYDLEHYKDSFFPGL